MRPVKQGSLFNTHREKDSGGVDSLLTRAEHPLPLPIGRCISSIHLISHNPDLARTSIYLEASSPVSNVGGTGQLLVGTSRNTHKAAESQSLIFLENWTKLPPTSLFPLPGQSWDVPCSLLLHLPFIFHCTELGSIYYRMSLNACKE